MSHFPVTVRIPHTLIPTATVNAIEGCLATLLAPYEECPEEGSPFLKFVPLDEAAHRLRYETGTHPCVRMPNGEIVSKHDKRFRVPYKPGQWNVTEHRVPFGLTLEEVPHVERFADFDTWMRDYCGYTRDADHGNMYGHLENPNAKWDWWSIGGRWSGFYVTPGGTTNAIRIREIDGAACATKQRQAAEAFWLEWLCFLTGAFDGPREQAMRVGLLRVEEAPGYVAKEGEMVFAWDQRYPTCGEKRSAWSDVAKVMTFDEFLTKYSAVFHPLRTFAILDEEGWHEPGEMGWFGCSSDTPETYLAYANTFVERVTKGDDRDMLVCVDCHI